MKGYWIYKHLNKEDECIYVGLTTDLKERQRQHRNDSSWRGEIYTIEYCDAKNKQTMKNLEIYFINSLLPKYNKKDKTGDDMSWMDLAIKEFEFKIYYRNKEYSKIKADSYKNDRLMYDIENKIFDLKILYNNNDIEADFYYKETKILEKKLNGVNKRRLNYYVDENNITRDIKKLFISYNVFTTEKLLNRIKKLISMNIYKECSTSIEKEKGYDYSYFLSKVNSEVNKSEVLNFILKKDEEYKETCNDIIFNVENNLRKKFGESEIIHKTNYGGTYTFLQKSYINIPYIILFKKYK